MKKCYDKMVFRAEASLLTQRGKLKPGRAKVTSEVTGGPVTQYLNCPALFPLPGTRNREEEGEAAMCLSWGEGRVWC